MLCCDFCRKFVHAGCCQLSKEEFDAYDQATTTQQFFCLECQQVSTSGERGNKDKQDAYYEPASETRRRIAVVPLRFAPFFHCFPMVAPTGVRIFPL